MADCRLVNRWGYLALPIFFVFVCEPSFEGGVGGCFAVRRWFALLDHDAVIICATSLRSFFIYDRTDA